MASSSSLLLQHNHKPLSYHLLPTSSFKNGGVSLSVAGRSNSFHTSPQLRAANKRSSRGRFVVRSDGSPEAGNLLSSLSDNPWFAGIAGLAVTVPFLIQRLLTFTKEVDMAAGTVEKIADAVGNLAEQVDHAAEDFGESLPEGGLKKVVSMVEDIAEVTAEEAEKVEDLMEKVDELTDRLEEFVTQSKSGETEKA